MNTKHGLLSEHQNTHFLYPFFHELVEAFRDKDPDLFFSLLAELPETLDDSFREKLQNLLTYEEGITNAMIYPYSNGKIEAKNTHIKTMKRVSYGFKSFENMRIRIFLDQSINQCKITKNLSQNVVHSDSDLIGSIIYGTDESELILQPHFHFRY
ncbi:hypothetical protein EfmAA96_29630 (plasmid) [Enterococcus faecium]|nr:hypothetical protein EfmAA96_29630 [Enterococcus faecium]